MFDKESMVEKKQDKSAEMAEIDSPKIETTAKLVVDAIVAEIVVGDNEEDSCDEDEDEMDGVENESDDYDDVIDTSTFAARRVQGQLGYTTTGGTSQQCALAANTTNGKNAK